MPLLSRINFHHRGTGVTEKEGCFFCLSGGADKPKSLGPLRKSEYLAYVESEHAPEGQMDSLLKAGFMIQSSSPGKSLVHHGDTESTEKEGLFLFCREVPAKQKYKGVKLDCGYRLDMVVESRLILELKACESVQPIHEAQLLTYLKLTGVKIGLLINFNVSVLRDGIKRIAN